MHSAVGRRACSRSEKAPASGLPTTITIPSFRLRFTGLSEPGYMEIVAKRYDVDQYWHTLGGTLQACDAVRATGRRHRQGHPGLGAEFRQQGPVVRRSLTAATEKT